MKIKTDFVTNSSSTSYCIYGIATSIHNLDENKYYELTKDKESFLDYKCGNSDRDGNNYIGLHPANILEMFPNLKCSEALEEIVKEINKVLGLNITNKDLSLYEDSWYDA